MAGVEKVSAGFIPPAVAAPSGQLSYHVAQLARVRTEVSGEALALGRELSELGDSKARELRQSVENLNGIARNLRKNLRFQVFEETGELFVQVVDSDTGEVIKSIPPLELLETLYRISEAVGLLIDEMG
jgi:flagellar protein FlaG